MNFFRGFTTGEVVLFLAMWFAIAVAVGAAVGACLRSDR